MSKKNKDIEAPQRKVKLVGDMLQVDEVYADGISGVIGRGGIIKLDFYRFLGFDEKEEAEVRQIVQRLVLPTSAVPVLAQAIKGVTEAGQKSMEQAQQRAKASSSNKKKKKKRKS